MVTSLSSNSFVYLLKAFGRFEGIIVISIYRTLKFIANGPIKLNN